MKKRHAFEAFFFFDSHQQFDAHIEFFFRESRHRHLVSSSFSLLSPMCCKKMWLNVDDSAIPRLFIIDVWFAGWYIGTVVRAVYIRSLIRRTLYGLF